ncbi:hypothetical protein E1293_34625 [Actinomadura darangshiensis]|uniref:Uncharacterized protein n=1 Tax=Actinomadura darangshiensis TaxID=705336 RepID=A0A4R5ADQ8_9ACTN|nr:hypothetical protein [Actinomadura darangshiensis]TDD70593.1 hypothetical protein E1293_34625 [Actinomadura darangshiensis]
MPENTIRAAYGANQFAGLLALTRWQLRIGLEHGLLPGPDLDGDRWSAALAEDAQGCGNEVITRFGGDPPVGSARAASRLASRVGLDVERPDIEVLVAKGDLNVISSFRGHPVYLLRDLDRLDLDSVRQVVTARKGPLTDTVDSGGAATILGWPRKTFDRIASERGLTADRLSRYALSDIRALQADANLAYRIAEEKRRLSLARTRRTETHLEDVIRAWVLRCSAYLDRDADEPPETAALGRALRTLTTIRTEMATHEATP